MKYQAVTDSGRKSPVSESRETIDGWASEQIRMGAASVDVYGLRPCERGKRPRAERLGNWESRL